MYYRIIYENGAERYGEFNSFEGALNYAESFNGGWDYTIEEYDDAEECFKEE